MHMVTTTNLALRLLPSINAWPTNLDPDIPYGWPTAIAPPFTFKFSFGIPNLSLQYKTCTAKASFSSHKSISSILRLFLSSSLGTA